MSLLNTGPTTGKIENTNTVTHIALTLTYLEKEPVIVTDFSLPLLVVTFFLLQIRAFNSFEGSSSTLIF